MTNPDEFPIPSNRSDRYLQSMMPKWTTGFIDLPGDMFAIGTQFWRTITGSALSASRGPDGEFATLLPPDGDTFLRVQRVDRADVGVHLNLHVDDVGAFVARVESLGASARIRADPHVVLASPGGLVFCVVPFRGESRRPRPVPLSGGVLVQVDQVAIDIPSVLFERECTFWSEVTGWERTGAPGSEFSPLLRPAGMPLRLLCHRLGDDDESESVRGHMDLACGDNVSAVATIHRSLGATIVRRAADFTTLRDPTGLPYCLTRRDPVTGMLPP